jgi:hypothetical protein
MSIPPAPAAASQFASQARLRVCSQPCTEIWVHFNTVTATSNRGADFWTSNTSGRFRFQSLSGCQREMQGLSLPFALGPRPDINRNPAQSNLPCTLDPHTRGKVLHLLKTGPPLLNFDGSKRNTNTNRNGTNCGQKKYPNTKEESVPR